VWWAAGRAIAAGLGRRRSDATARVHPRGFIHDQRMVVPDSLTYDINDDNVSALSRWLDGAPGRSPNDYDSGIGSGWPFSLLMICAESYASDCARYLISRGADGSSPITTSSGLPASVGRTVGACCFLSFLSRWELEDLDSLLLVFLAIII